VLGNMPDEEFFHRQDAKSAKSDRGQIAILENGNGFHGTLD
jgi:hypothetical protein